MNNLHEKSFTLPHVPLKKIPLLGMKRHMVICLCMLAGKGEVVELGISSYE